MTENPIKSADDLIGLIEADAVCLPGVRLCDVDLVTGALRILMRDGRRFEMPAPDRSDGNASSTATAHRRGTWRSSTKARPGSMTAFIRLHTLLDTAEIDDAPVDLVRFQNAAAALPIDERPALGGWIERFNAGVTQLAA